MYTLGIWRICDIYVDELARHADNMNFNKHITNLDRYMFHLYLESNKLIIKQLWEMILINRTFPGCAHAADATTSAPGKRRRAVLQLRLRLDLALNGQRRKQIVEPCLDDVVPRFGASHQIVKAGLAELLVDLLFALELLQLGRVGRFGQRSFHGVKVQVDRDGFPHEHRRTVDRAVQIAARHGRIQTAVDVSETGARHNRAAGGRARIHPRGAMSRLVNLVQAVRLAVGDAMRFHVGVLQALDEGELGIICKYCDM